ncbi:nck-associated protein 5-like [Alligator sinensis]|uniref:Nck-associated protein 5-like n=1 Tax=Alligator sinensis TaxID=38654 RepID=A0A3Q0H7Z4_ALLSI|nr:nck-associated protein 5-like [Alligator sinensis]
MLTHTGCPERGPGPGGSGRRSPDCPAPSQVENSALAQANENQRETYERCLDEVANHVVQALLNQKDLREECIKLKRRVFDLERQNQTLSDLFQQKLQLAGGALPPLALQPVPAPANPPASPLRCSAENPAASPPPGRCVLHREVCGPAPPRVPLLARASHGSSPAPQVGSEGPWGGGSGPGPPALEALSPFFKKKAQILEVLRKLEETDPLLPACCGRPTQPSSGSCSTPLAGHQSRPESPGSPEGVNRAPTLEPWPGCLQLGSKWRGPEAEGGCASPSPEEPVLSALAEQRLGLGLLLEDAECYLHEDAAEPRVSARVGGSLKHQEHGPSAELPARCYLSGSVGSRLEAEACSGKHHITKTRPLATGCPAGPPPGARNPPRAPPAPPGKSTKSPHGKPTKLPSKSPTKAGAGKTAVPRPPTEEVPTGPERRAPEGPGGPGPPSAIEEKVMKGIEENVLRLQGQDRGPVPEVKQKDSRGLASWFGLRKSKLPALSRRPEPGKAKEERRERGPGATPLRREVRLAARKLEAESLNISKLMEKAEDLRKALEQEKAYLHGLARDRARPHGRREPTPSELQALYREVTAQDFMQQLLDRVDGKETSLDSRLEQKNELLELQRIPHDAKDPRLFRPPRNGIVGHLRSCEEPPEKVPDLSLREGLPPDDSLAEAVTAQHFPACGSLTRTLDSGIGTFPPPDYCSGVPSKPPPKPKSRSDTPPGTAPGRPPASTKVPRKARTLEREVPSLEDVPGPPGVPPSTAPPPSLRGHRVCHEATEPHSELGKPRRAQQGRNWTFPNIRASGGPAADPFLCTPGDLAGLRGPAGGSARSTTARKRAASEGPPPLPPPSLALSASSSRTPSASDVGEEGSTEAGSRDTGQGPAGLENSESLSDSLYDSLSSCGSQG